MGELVTSTDSVALNVQNATHKEDDATERFLGKRKRGNRNRWARWMTPYTKAQKLQLKYLRSGNLNYLMRSDRLYGLAEWRLNSVSWARTPFTSGWFGYQNPLFLEYVESRVWPLDAVGCMAHSSCNGCTRSDFFDQDWKSCIGICQVAANRELEQKPDERMLNNRNINQKIKNKRQ